MATTIQDPLSVSRLLLDRAKCNRDKIRKDSTNTNNNRFIIRKSIVSPNTVIEDLLNSWGKWMLQHKDHKDNKFWKIHYKPAKSILLSKYSSIALDISVLCAIYTIGGPHLKNYLRNFSGTLVDVFNHLIDKYKLVNASEKENITSKGICLFGIAKCFPNVCCELYALGICGNMVPLNIFGRKLKGKRRAVLCPLFPMVASHTLFNRTRSNILPQLLWISYNTNTYINTDVAKQKANIVNIFESLKCNIFTKMIDEKHRRELCIRWGLLTDKFLPTQFWAKTRGYCINKLESEFADKRYWFLIKKEIDNFLINCY